MNDIDLNFALVGRLVRHRWPVLAVLAVLGGLLGAAASPLLSPGYAASCKLLLPASLGKAAQVAEAQIAMSLVVLDRTADALNWGDKGDSLRGRVTASVEDGNVLQIVGTASTPERAQQLTDRATSEYVTFSSQIAKDAAAAYNDASSRSRDRVQKQIDETQKRINELQGSPQVSDPGPDGIKARDELDRAQSTLSDAQAELGKLDEQQQAAQLENAVGGGAAKVIEPPVVPTSAASPSLSELVLGGAVALALLGLFAHLMALRADRRLRSQSDIASAAGAPLLGVVEVVEQRPPQHWFALRDDRRWVEPDLRVADDEHGRESRFRRILDRIRTDTVRQQVLVLVPEDDASARSAVLDMAVSAVKSGQRVSIATEDRTLGAQVAKAAERLDGRLILGTGGAGTHTAIGVCAVHVRRPLVPVAEPGSTTVLTVTAGTRTSGEVAEIALASGEAGRPLAGVVVVTSGIAEPPAKSARRLDPLAAR